LQIRRFFLDFIFVVYVGLYNTTTVSKCQIQMNYKEKQE